MLLAKRLHIFFINFFLQLAAAGEKKQCILFIMELFMVDNDEAGAFEKEKIVVRLHTLCFFIVYDCFLL